MTTLGGFINFPSFTNELLSKVVDHTMFIMLLFLPCNPSPYINTYLHIFEPLYFCSALHLLLNFFFMINYNCVLHVVNLEGTSSWRHERAAQDEGFSRAIIGTHFTYSLYTSIARAAYVVS